MNRFLSFFRIPLTFLRESSGIINDGGGDDEIQKELDEDGYRSVWSRVYGMIPAIFMSQEGRVLYYEQTCSMARLNEGSLSELLEYFLTPELWTQKLHSRNAGSDNHLSEARKKAAKHGIRLVA